MGEVFRARDGNLDRDVAIKLLPTALAGDVERLARSSASLLKVRDKVVFVSNFFEYLKKIAPVRR
jgi:hypothetical protein